MKAKKKSGKSTATKKRYEGFTAEEKAAMQDRVQEMKVAAQKADGESEVLAKIAALPASDRDMAKRLHAVIKASAPALSPKTWYGMPAYAKDGKIVCSENLVRHARVCQRRQDRLLLSKRPEVQDEVRDSRLQRRGAPRRRQHVADRLRADEVDPRRRGTDRRARQESGELRTQSGYSSFRQLRGSAGCVFGVRSSKKLK